MSQDLPSEVQQQILAEFKDDPQVFEKIYEFYYEMILKYLVKRTMSAEVAYDLTADTFIKAFESLHKFKWTGVSIKVWLYRIAINALKNQRRHPESSALENVPEGHESLAAYTTRHGALASAADAREELKELDKVLFGDEEMAKLSDAMATLKPEHQNIISLYYFTGMSQKEIAETTESSESAVKATMHRAMTNLRELLSPNPA
ncbi:sigma-70 family RNA polymerase sigma factor [Candidatus Peregrinibacteria bacterium]|nr:sigma-70 family RNA polymerase sigma factor [Candidatus Peregrinibacteria bacterium]